MAKRRFGTNAVTGLNVGTASHLIADHELVSSVGGWTDEEGCWRTGRDHVTVHSGTAISAMAVGRMSGQDHTVYVDGDDILDTGSVVGTVPMGPSPLVVPAGGMFIVLGASDGKNKVYDGNHVRDHGPWQPHLEFVTGISTAGSPATYTVDAGGGGITKAAEAKVYLTSTASLAVGMPVRITGVVGMTEINDKNFVITSIDPGGSPAWITIDCDSSGFTTYTSGGTLYRQACGLEGDYQFMMTGIIELGDGSVLESAPIWIGDRGTYTGTAYTGDESQTYSLTTLSLCVLAATARWIQYNSIPEYNITGTRGTDYKPGLRLYRTKAAGTDFYLEKEWRDGDDDLTYGGDATVAYYTVDNYFVHVKDVDLGALYTAGDYDHGSPPQSSLAAQVGQRVFVNDVDNPERVYVSGLDGTEYFNPSDWLVIPDNVTVLRRVRDRLVIGTATRWYLVDMISGFPQVLELDTSTGVLSPASVTVNDQGLFFVKPEGIFHLDLVSVSKISRRAIRDADLDTGLSAIVTADVGIFVCDPAGAASTAVACIRDGGWTWHTARETLQHTHLAKNSMGQIQGALPTKIEMLFIGSDYYGELSSKVFSDGGTWQPIRLLLDIETSGSVTCQYQITTNRGALFSGYQTATVSATARQIVDLPLTRKPAETFQIQLSISGDAKLYGYAIEVEG